MLSQRVQNLKSSPTLALIAKAKELTNKGHDVISLTVGEPDWPTYEVAARAGIKAIENGNTKYTPAQGTMEIRQAIVSRVKTDLGLEYDASKEVVVTSGAKFALYACLQVLCDKEDEVIIPTPYWVSYPSMVDLSDGNSVLIKCDENVGFKLTAQELEKHITSKTKVFLFCSPSNPTGLVYSEQELKEIAEVLKKHPQICIMSDDMYNRLMHGKALVAPHLLQVAPELKERTVIFNGGSKAYAMTGWRIGWAMGPAKILKAMGDYVSQTTGAPSSIAQAAAEQALIHSEKDIFKTNEMLKSRLDNALKEFQSIPEFKVYPPDGAFYLWVNVKKTLERSYKDKKVGTSAELCRILLEDFFVSTVPGEEFGHEGYMRLSFAIQNEKMNEAISRMKQLLRELK